jgi:hypothetical protein
MWYWYEYYMDLASNVRQVLDTIEIVTIALCSVGGLLVLVAILLRVLSGKAKKKAQKEIDAREKQAVLANVLGVPLTQNNMGQPIIQPITQPMSQTMMQPMAQPMMQPMGQPMAQPMGQPMMQPMVQPMTPPVAPVMAPVTSPVATPVEQSATPVSLVESAVDLDEKITID